MDEIMISKKWVVVMLVIGLGAGLLWGVPGVLEQSPTEGSASPVQTPSQKAQAGQADSEAQKAAATGGQAFFSVGYAQGKQA